MAEKSNMTALGTKAPDFKLPDVTGGKTISLGTFGDKKGLLVTFMCRHCPYVRHVQNEIAKIGNEYPGKGIGVVAISANDAVAYPDDAPQSLKEQAKQLGFTFPYCYDESQEVAKAYGAACTPDFFLFDDKRRLVYRGQLDDSRPGSSFPTTGKDLRRALDLLLEGQTVPEPEQKPSVGCSIKWR